MSFLRPTPIHPNRGSDIEALITLQGSDGDPIDLGENPVLVSLVDVSPGISNAEILAVLTAPFGRAIVTIPWDDNRQSGVGYSFRVRYFFEGDDIVYTTPLFGVVYQ